MTLKPGPKPIAKSTGKTDQRRRDNRGSPSSSTSDSKNNITQTCTTPPRPNSK